MRDLHALCLKILWGQHQLGKCNPANCRWCNECPGHERGGKAPPCCDRAGEYNGYGSGPLEFHCPKSCSCHD
jgi:hypothetical protein